MLEGTRKSALSEGVIAGVLFGTAAIFIRYATEMDPFSIVFWRLVIASGAIALVSVLFRSLQIGVIKKSIKEILVLGLFLAFHFVFFTAAVRDTSILNATVLVNTVPFFSLLISSVTLKFRPSYVAVVGMLISFVGILVIASAELMSSAGTGIISQSLEGDLEAIFAALLLAAYLNYGQKVRNQMNILSVMLPVYTLAAVIVGVLGTLATSTALSSQVRLVTFLPLIGLGLFPTAIAHTLYFSSLSNLRAFETATLALLEPLGATVLGMVVFQETPGPMFAVGAVFVLTGIFFAIREKR